jgi:transcriptional regulator with PAS, ATPase and Fis domain
VSSPTVIVAASRSWLGRGFRLAGEFQVADPDVFWKSGNSDTGFLAILLDADPPPDWPGFKLLARRKASRCYTLVALEQGFAWTLGQRARLLLSGASRLVDFALDSPEALSQLLTSAFDAWSAADRETAGLHQRMQAAGFVGRSADALNLFRLAARIANLHNLPALITGETGTGKEVLARVIHLLDPKRCGHRFVAINCAALAPALLESELFGFRRGAFTGADRDRSGLFRAAEGGVIFLDEVGELDPGLQAKLLRVLQTETVIPLGEDREIPVNVRVIAATNRCLEQMVEKGEFREDLFYRLNVVRFRIPPLRERPADISSHIRQFLERHRDICRFPVDGVSPDFEAAIRKARLPGNARQLENIIKAALLSKNEPGPLDLADCPEEVWAELATEIRPPRLGPAVESSSLEEAIAQTLRSNGWSLDRAIRTCERIMVQSALSETRGNQAATARLLGITSRSVYNKLRRHRLTA